MPPHEKKITRPTEGGKKSLVLYKYLTPNALFGLLEYGDIRITCQEDVNDPYELLPRGSLPNHESSSLGFISFTKKPNSPPMWGNYAEKYKGACVKFAFEYFYFRDAKHKQGMGARLADSGIQLKERGMRAYFLQYEEIEPRVAFLSFNNVIVQCSYCRERPDREKEREQYEGTKEERDISRSYDTWKVLSSKHEDWAYEEEYRLFVLKKDATRTNFKSPLMRFSSFPTRYIKKIILGPYFDHKIEDIKNIIDLRRREQTAPNPYLPSNLEICKADFSETSYGLNI